MMNMKRTALFLALAVLLIAGSASAFNLGSSIKQGNAEVVGDKAEFSILIWTSDTEPVIVRLALLEKPDKWVVSILPENLSITRDSGDEMVAASGEYLGASLVKVVAYTPKGVAPGVYEIRIKASAFRGASEMQSGQERVFTLRATASSSSVPNPGDAQDFSAFILAGAIIILAAMAGLRFLR